MGGGSSGWGIKWVCDPSVCVWLKCMCCLTVCRGQVGGWSSGWMVKWVGGPVVGGQVGVWPKCVWMVKVCGQSVCMCVWPKYVQGSSGWVVKWVGGQVGGGSSGWGSSGYVVQVCVRVVKVCG